MDLTASVKSKAQLAASDAEAEAVSVMDGLKRLHPDTWNAILAKAAKQADTLPDGMSNATEPAYRYVPGEA